MRKRTVSTPVCKQLYGVSNSMVGDNGKVRYFVRIGFEVWGFVPESCLVLVRTMRCDQVWPQSYDILWE